MNTCNSFVLRLLSVDEAFERVSQALITITFKIANVPFNCSHNNVLDFVEYPLVFITSLDIQIVFGQLQQLKLLRSASSRTGRELLISSSGNFHLKLSGDVNLRKHEKFQARLKLGLSKLHSRGKKKKTGVAVFKSRISRV